MSSTYKQILYQIVYSTKHRELSMRSAIERKRVFEYMSGVLRRKKCHLYCLNGVEDHLHIITSLHPSIALADLVKDLKLSASEFIEQEGIFSNFPGWQDGYSAFTYHIESKEELIEYVKNQEEHHQTETYIDELKRLLAEHQIEYDERYLL